uniref:Uncharacterized protein n=1 Tax=Parascaris univalens TaxID=6257 RepID=A0A915AXE8_PARUN
SLSKLLKADHFGRRIGGIVSSGSAACSSLPRPLIIPCSSLYKLSSVILSNSSLVLVRSCTMRMSSAQSSSPAVAGPSSSTVPHNLRPR